MKDTQLGRPAMSGKRKPGPKSSRLSRMDRREAALRIIGGRLRGRTVRHAADPATRPMKDRVREAVFNLIGPAVRDKFVIDLFAGTGAMGLESLSRGASRAVLIERRFPAARIIEQNAADLGLGDQVLVVPGDVFVWARLREHASPQPWLVFCCPPYEFYVSRLAAVLTLVEGLLEHAPWQSLFVVESDERFDTGRLPRAGLWDVRRYRPAVIAVMQKRPERSEPRDAGNPGEESG